MKTEATRRPYLIYYIPFLPHITYLQTTALLSFEHRTVESLIAITHLSIAYLATPHEYSVADV